MTFWKMGGGFDVICTLFRLDEPFKKGSKVSLYDFKPCIKLGPSSSSVHGYYYDADFNILTATLGSLVLGGGLTMMYVRYFKRKLKDNLV